MTNKSAMTIEAIKITGKCTCHAAYTSRKKQDPNCRYCEYAEEITDALTEAYARGRRDGLESAAKLIEEWAVYFDKYEAYCGKYAPSTGRETLTPEDCASAIRALTEKEKQDG